MEILAETEDCAESDIDAEDIATRMKRLLKDLIGEPQTPVVVCDAADEIGVEQGEKMEFFQRISPDGSNKSGSPKDCEPNQDLELEELM